MDILDDIQRKKLERSLELLIGKGHIDPGYTDAQIVTMAIDELAKNLLDTVKLSATLAGLIRNNTDMIVNVNSKISLAMEKINASLN